MGWTITVNTNSAGALDTGDPLAGVQATWTLASALGFFGSIAAGPVTVGTYQTFSALMIDTTDATTPQYVNNVRYLGPTSYGLSTPIQATESIVNRNSTDVSNTSIPVAYGVKFGFTTAGAVQFTQASAWYGVYNETTVVGDSSDAGFGLMLSELTTSKAGWDYIPISTLKADLNTYLQYRQAMPEAVAGVWYIALSARPNSAGGHGGAVAIDITYS